MSETTIDTAPTAPVEPSAAVYKDSLASLASQVRNASPGTLARLRRIHPQHDGRAALFESEWLLQAAGIRPQDSDEQHRWDLLLHSLAIAQWRHKPGKEFEPGHVLAQLRVSETRVKQLVEADAAVLSDLVPRLARRLAAAQATIDWRPLADLLLHAGSSADQRMGSARERRADIARRRIVREYLKATGRANAGDVPATADA